MNNECDRQPNEYNFHFQFTYLDFYKCIDKKN